MLKFIKDNHGEKIALGGLVCIFLGAAMFLGATPRGQEANDVGEAWIMTVPFIVVGAGLLALNWYWNR